MKRFIVLLALAVVASLAQNCDLMADPISSCTIEGTNDGGVCTITSLNFVDVILEDVTLGGENCNQLILNDVAFRDAEVDLTILANQGISVNDLSLNNCNGNLSLLVISPSTVGLGRNEVVKFENTKFYDSILALAFIVPDWTAVGSNAPNSALFLTGISISESLVSWLVQIADVVADPSTSNIDLYGIRVESCNFGGGAITFNWNVQDVVSSQTGTTTGISIQQSLFDGSFVTGSMSVLGTIGFSGDFVDVATTPISESFGIHIRNSGFTRATISDFTLHLGDNANVKSIGDSYGILVRFVDFQRANVNNFFFLAAQTSGIYGLNVFGVEVAFCDFQDGNFAGWGFVYEGTLSSYLPDMANPSTDEALGRAIRISGFGSDMTWSGSTVSFTGNLNICDRLNSAGKYCTTVGAVGLHFELGLTRATIQQNNYLIGGNFRSGPPKPAEVDVRAIFSFDTTVEPYDFNWDQSNWTSVAFVTFPTVEIFRNAAQVAEVRGNVSLAGNPSGIDLGMSMVGSVWKDATFTDTGTYTVRNDALNAIRFSSNMTQMTMSDSNITTSGTYIFNQRGAVVLLGGGYDFMQASWTNIDFQVGGGMTGGALGINAVTFGFLDFAGTQWNDVNMNVDIFVTEDVAGDGGAMGAVRGFYFSDVAFNGASFIDCSFDATLKNTSTETLTYFGFYWENPYATTFWQNFYLCNVDFTSNGRRHDFISDVDIATAFSGAVMADSSITATNIVNGPLYSTGASIFRSDFNFQQAWFIGNSTSLTALCNSKVNDFDIDNIGMCGGNTQVCEAAGRREVRGRDARKRSSR